MSSHLFIFSFLLALISTAAVETPVPYINDCNAYHCFEKGNYTSESLSRANLNTLLDSLSINIGPAGFNSSSIGEFSAIALCRGDIQLDECRSCVDLVTKEIPQQCPYRMQAIRWSEYCMVRYSNESILKILTDSPVKHLRSLENVTNSDRFSEARTELIDKLRGEVLAGGNDRRKVAAGSREARNNQTVYAMMQCTPDLSVDECDRCLAEAAANIPACCENAMGARVYKPSCILRYESELFYNTTRLQELSVDSQPQGNDEKNNKSRKVIIAIVASVVSLTLLAFCIAIYIFMRKRSTKQKMILPTKNHDPEEFGDKETVSTAESLQYDFDSIRVATSSFCDANKLGQGGFGAVYRGKLGNGEEIAVKRLSKKSGQGDMEFKNEVVLIAKLQHRNLVRLLGFCQEGNEKLLVYEFVQNGSLDHFIFDYTMRSSLDWDKRREIIMGIAKGLVYLHEDSRLCVIHRDLKASNILLDEKMNPKISDFGMARMVMRDTTLENTQRIVGTYGYMAPEYAKHGQFSTKSDVFSFGVLMLEIITGKKRVFHRDIDNPSEHLINYVWRFWCEGMVANIIDPTLGAGSASQQDIEKYIHIALLCLQDDASNRPTMASVILFLNGTWLPLPMPSRPAFSTPYRSLENSLSHSSSITKIYPR